jgi:Fur family transcriptional regulator, peroxide stress response regulator
LNISLEYIREKLIKANLKATQQRMVVFKALSEVDSHPSSDRIFEMVHTENPSISLATVYNTLDSLVEAGLAKRVLSGKGPVRYDARIDNHHHLICSNTKEIIDFFDEELNDLIKNYLEKKKIQNFHLEDMQLQIRGEKIVPGKEIRVK